MFVFQLICICLVVLCLTGAADGLCSHLRLERRELFMTALAYFVLSGFDYQPYPELCINAAVIIFPLTPLLFTDKGHVDQKVPVILLFSGIVSAIALEYFSGFYASVTAVVSSFASVLFLYESPRTALFASSASAICGVFIRAFVELVGTGYTACKLSGANVMNAQLLAYALTLLLIYAMSAIRERITIRYR